MSAAFIPPASPCGTHWQRGHLACSNAARTLGPAVHPPLRACLHRARRGEEETAQLSTAHSGVHLRVPRWERRHPAGPAACSAGPDRQPTTTVCPASSRPVGQQCPLPLFPQRPRAGPIGSAGISPAATQRESLVQPSTHHFARVCTTPDGASRSQSSSQPLNPASTFVSPAGSAGILPAQRRVRLDPTVSQPQPSARRHPSPWGSNVRCLYSPSVPVRDPLAARASCLQQRSENPWSSRPPTTSRVSAPPPTGRRGGSAAFSRSSRRPPAGPPLGAPASCRPSGVCAWTRPSNNHNRLASGIQPRAPRNRWPSF